MNQSWLVEPFLQGRFGLTSAEVIPRVMDALLADPTEDTMRKLGDVTLDHNPIILDQTASVLDACDRMRDGRAGLVLVTGGSGKLVGVFTGRDAVCRVLAQRCDAATTPLAEAMTPNPITMSPEQSTSQALRLMRAGGFRHLPLLKNGRIAGLISRGDFNGLQQKHHEEERDLWEHLR